MVHSAFFVAAAALTVRWGSYLAVLLDHDKPLWPEVQSARTSRISDEEMARINIEASAALAEWIDIDREDEGLYRQLAHHPSRLFANALVNVAWRNGPVENIHAGSFHGYPLAQRRVTPAEEKELMQSASDGLALGMTVRQVLARERPERPWPEQVLPYGLASMMLITPSRWTLTEASREVRLPT